MRRRDLRGRDLRGKDLREKDLRGRKMERRNWGRTGLKKMVTLGMCVATLTTVLTGCASDSKKSDKITVVSREDGSGTRSAFVELTGVMVDDSDKTVSSAEITNSTSVMITTVAGDKNAIGYISLGSMNDSIKALKVEGVEATSENVKGGSYGIARPFIVVTKGEVSDVAQDFIDFVLSDDGQAIVEEEGYISDMTGTKYENSGMSGTVTLAGSTSVAPVMEVLTEQYKKINEDVKFEIQQTGSSAGITSTIEGACDIGMSSRDLKDTEEAEGLTVTKIATDGIAVIVNKENEIDDIAMEDIVKIYTGEVESWEDLKEEK